MEYSYKKNIDWSKLLYKAHKPKLTDLYLGKSYIDKNINKILKNKEDFANNFRYFVIGHPDDIIDKLGSIDNSLIVQIIKLYKKILNEYKKYNNDYYALFMGYKYIEVGSKKYIYIPTYGNHTNKERDDMEKRIRYFPTIISLAIKHKNKKLAKVGKNTKDTLNVLGFSKYLDKS